uniref:Myb transcription factor n=1 Tax=Cladonia uncialis subsp. uncialis TaxID=180999 RepID=A0A1Z1C4E0_CLAUC|nr:hypothetical protein [Cladonia uncialis subsp. uncialis]AUW31226.1 hypothetical protein [Cladonia uncialis subsp. uncialis]
MARERRKWTDAEDSLLREAVSKAIQESRPLLWRELAKSVPGRTNKDCRRRWCNTIAEGMAKGAWTESEDERLSSAVQRYGSKWTRIAAAVETRTSDQCSSHWNQTLNPDIDYSDWTNDEDGKILLGVQRFGTNWSKITSIYLPHRTSLALKNRFSAIRIKTNRARTASTNTPNPRTGRLKSNRKQTPKAGFRDRNLAVTSGKEADEQSQDDEEDDEDDEEEDEDDEDQDGNDGDAFNAGELLEMDWQQKVPTNTSAGLGQISSAQTVHQPAPFYMPAHTEDQTPFNRTSVSTEPWHAEVPQDPTSYSSAFPYTFAQNGYPVSLYQYQYANKVSVSQAAFPPIPSADLPLESFSNDVSYTLQREPSVLIDNFHRPPSALGSKETNKQAARQKPSPKQIQGHVDQDSGPQELSPMRATASEIASPSSQTSTPSEHPTTDNGLLQHISIDAVCTAEQIGSIMGNIVGRAKSVTVKVDSWSLQQAGGQA